MEKVIEKKHPYLEGVICRSNGEIYVPATKYSKGHWSFGTINAHGYYQICYNKKIFKVHRLIAETFIDNPNSYKEIDHINRDKSDNIVSNLRWCNRSQNCRNKTNNKSCYQFSIDGNFIKYWSYIKDAEEKLGYDGSSITKCCKGKLKSAYGYIWRYAEPNSEQPLW